MFFISGSSPKASNLASAMDIHGIAQLHAFWDLSVEIDHLSLLPEKSMHRDSHIPAAPTICDLELILHAVEHLSPRMTPRPLRIPVRHKNADFLLFPNFV
jgi:hypothetical protein